MMNYTRFTESDFAKLGSKLVDNLYRRNQIEVIVYDNKVWAFDRCLSDRAYNIVVREMKKHRPDLKYLYEEA